VNLALGLVILLVVGVAAMGIAALVLLVSLLRPSAVEDPSLSPSGSSR